MKTLFKNLNVFGLVLFLFLFVVSITFSACTGQQSDAENATEEVMDEPAESDEHPADTQESEHPSDTTSEGEGEHPSESGEESEHPDN